jgi:hypothetical protein
VRDLDFYLFIVVISCGIWISTYYSGNIVRDLEFYLFIVVIS